MRTTSNSQFNLAFFDRIFVDDELITTQLATPFAELHALRTVTPDLSAAPPRVARTRPTVRYLRERSLEPYVGGSRVACMVDLAQHLSNLPRLEKRLVRLLRKPSAGCQEPPPRPDPPLPHRKRLPPEQVSELVRRYQSGTTLRVLAAELGVSRSVVGRVLRTAGVSLRPRGTQPGRARRDDHGRFSPAGA